MKIQQVILLLPILNLRDNHPIAYSGKPNSMIPAKGRTTQAPSLEMYVTSSPVSQIFWGQGYNNNYYCTSASPKKTQCHVYSVYTCSAYDSSMLYTSSMSPSSLSILKVIGIIVDQSWPGNNNYNYYYRAIMNCQFIVENPRRVVTHTLLHK